MNKLSYPGLSTGMHASPAITKRERCLICGGNTDQVMDLPVLPFTETYCRQPLANPLAGIDQKMLFCSGCGHGQLAAQIAPDVLYGTNYVFRTSASATARKGTKFFLSVLDEVAPGRQFRCVLDLGCNDLFLLSRLQGRCRTRIGIDPVWRGRESEHEDQSIIVHGCSLEESPLSALPERPDLVVCRHTLEHIADPILALRLLMDAAAPDALFVFEVPGFDGLVSRFRFDQVFHQHLQYFSLSSFLRLLEKVGADFLLHRENFHDWGAMAVAFTRGATVKPVEPTRPPPSLDLIKRRYGQFQRQMAMTTELLAELRETRIYGYGAAQMLPVLAYHMGTDLGTLEAVLDDDPEKDGIGYWNLPVRVMPSARAIDLQDSAVLITAVDNVQPIMTKLLTIRPRHIIYPFHLI